MIRIKWRSIFRFRLRTLLIGTTIVAIWLGSHIQLVNEQELAVKVLKEQGARFYDGRPDPIGPNWLWKQSLIEHWHHNGIPFVSAACPGLQKYLVTTIYDFGSIYPGVATTKYDIEKLSQARVRYLYLHANADLDLSLLQTATDLKGMTIFVLGELTSEQVNILARLNSIEVLELHTSAPLKEAERFTLERAFIGRELSINDHDRP